MLLRPSWGPDPNIDPSTTLDLSPECWEPWLKRTLLSWGGLSSLWAKNSSYCLFMDAETTWKRMSGRRMACLKMLWALEVMQTETGHGGQEFDNNVLSDHIWGTGVWYWLLRGDTSSRLRDKAKIEGDTNYINCNYQHLGRKEISYRTLYTQLLKCLDMSWKTELMNQQGIFGHNVLLHEVWNLSRHA